MARTTARISHYKFGTIRINGVTYDRDVLIDQGAVRRRHKKPSREFREGFGHTPLSLREDIPWECERLVVGTGALGALPVMVEVEMEAARRGVQLVSLPTLEAIDYLRREGEQSNAILHLTC